MTKPLRLTQVERKEISDTKMLEVAIDLIVERGTCFVYTSDAVDDSLSIQLRW